MTLNEKVAHLKGLIEGLGFKPETPEQKIIAEVVDILDDLAKTTTDTENEVEYLSDYVDELDADLGDVEEYLFADDDVDDYDDEDDDEYWDDEDDDDEDYEDDEDEVYEFECPECGEKIYFSNALADKQEITCPSCNKKLTFDAEE